MSKKIILTADDFGVSNFINEGIYIALENKKINTVSTFVTHRQSENSIQGLLKFKNNNRDKFSFNIGLHFSVTSGFSVQPNKTTLTDLSENGMHRFYEPIGYLFKKESLSDIKAELKGQLKKLDDVLGNELIIDHVSCHHGIPYIEMDYYKVFLEGIKEYCSESTKYDKNIPIRSPKSWLKFKEPGIFNLISSPFVHQGFDLGMMKKLNEVTKKKLEERQGLILNYDIEAPDFLVDVIYGQPSVERFNDILEKMEENETVEFMFHLGDGNYDDRIVPNGINMQYFEGRKEELQNLLAWDIESLINNSEVQLTDFQNLKKFPYDP